MNPWGYVAVGIVCGVVAGFFFGIAGPSGLDVAIAASAGNPAPQASGALMFVGYVFAAAASVLTLIGVIAEGVRIGMREVR